MGSICSAVIVCRLFGLPDPRVEGSKNPGATNVLRLAGKQYAIIVMIIDLLKGTIPVLIAKYFNASPIIVGFTALAAVVGHMYPVFFGFKGGKGVATAIGALLGFHFILGIVVSATWLIVAKFSKFSSLASMVSMSLTPIYAIMIIGDSNVFPPLLMIAILIVYKHRNNITRLMDGVEPKIKFRHSVIEEVMESFPEPAKPVETFAPENLKNTEQHNVEEVNEPIQKTSRQKASGKKLSTPNESMPKPKSAKPKSIKVEK